MRFRGKYYFLSNFYPHPFQFRSLVVPTAEHGFQALKATTLRDAERVARCVTPGQAKWMGRQILCRPDWEVFRIRAMRMVLEAKFSEPRLGDLLLSTGEEELVEDNTWDDTFWGRCNGEGQNHLGRILMEIRGGL